MNKSGGLHIFLRGWEKITICKRERESARLRNVYPSGLYVLTLNQGYLSFQKDYTDNKTPTRAWLTRRYKTHTHHTHTWRRLSFQHSREKELSYLIINLCLTRKIMLRFYDLSIKKGRTLNTCCDDSINILTNHY